MSVTPGRSLPALLPPAPTENPRIPLTHGTQRLKHISGKQKPTLMQKAENLFVIRAKANNKSMCTPGGLGVKLASVTNLLGNGTIFFPMILVCKHKKESGTRRLGPPVALRCQSKDGITYVNSNLFLVSSSTPHASK